MGKTNTFAVIGLGQFGLAIVEELVALGNDVIAIDKNPERVKKVNAILNTAFVCDSTAEDALIELGINEVDHAIVAFGDNQQASILTTVLLKDMGVPHVVVRVDDDNYVPIMKKLGATEVISPQKAAGIGLANRLGNADFKDFHKLESKYNIVSMVVNDAFQAKALRLMNSKNIYGVNIVLTSREGKCFVPGGDDEVRAKDTIYVVGTNKEIKAFRESINGKYKD